MNSLDPSGVGSQLRMKNRKALVARARLYSLPVFKHSATPDLLRFAPISKLVYTVTPAKAGVQKLWKTWLPAFTQMTLNGV
jgi:hypothetical protein